MIYLVVCFSTRRDWDSHRGKVTSKVSWKFLLRLKRHYQCVVNLIKNDGHISSKIIFPFKDDNESPSVVRTVWDIYMQLTHTSPGADCVFRLCILSGIYTTHTDRVKNKTKQKTSVLVCRIFRQWPELSSLSGRHVNTGEESEKMRESAGAVWKSRWPSVQSL